MASNATQEQFDVKEMRFPPCIARQPILTADKRVFGYELLFREGKEDYFFGKDSEGATRATLNTSVLVGLDVLGDGHPAFINFTRDILQKEYARLFP
jgi:EAL and modified HD-GYP domain-containing signal transduction protein